MTKIKMLAAAVAVASVSTMAGAAVPTAPSVYNTGPMSPAVNTTNLSEQERIAFALLEGMMQASEAYVHANGCPANKLTIPLSAYADALGAPAVLLPFTGNVGVATLGSAPNIFILRAKADNSNNFRGQIIDVAQATLVLNPFNDPLPQYINGKATANFVNKMTYNSANNMMVGDMSVDTMSINGSLNSFKGLVIKDFYKGEDKSGTTNNQLDNELFLIIDWGLQSLSKYDYPVEKYWQRSKTRRSDGGNGQTVFVKDRLVGVTPCRITVALSGSNGPSIFNQAGSLSIESVTPSTTSTELNAVTTPAP